jgi:hypothetical protein
MARTFGRAMREIRNASADLQNEIKKSGLDVKNDLNLSAIIQKTEEEIEQPLDQVMVDIKETVHYGSANLNEAASNLNETIPSAIETSKNLLDNSEHQEQKETIDISKDTVVKNNLKIFNKKIDYQLKQFWDDNSGLVCVPFEMTFKNTENKIEKTISEAYPEFYTWNFLDLNDPKIRDRYYKMKGELERGLTKEDNFAILQSFFDDKLFFPKKKYHPYLIFDTTSTIVKPFGEPQSPHIILQGRLFFYGKRWLDSWMTESRVTLKKYLGGRTLSFYWKDMPPAFLMHMNQTLFRDWIATEVARRFTDKESVEFKLANKILE